MSARSRAQPQRFPGLSLLTSRCTHSTQGWVCVYFRNRTRFVSLEKVGSKKKRKQQDVINMQSVLANKVGSGSRPSTFPHSTSSRRIFQRLLLWTSRREGRKTKGLAQASAEEKKNEEQTPQCCNGTFPFLKWIRGPLRALQHYHSANPGDRLS